MVSLDQLPASYKASRRIRHIVPWVTMAFTSFRCTMPISKKPAYSRFIGVVTPSATGAAGVCRGAEYDLDPYRIERQAQVIVRAPVFMKLLEQFAQNAEQEPENLSDDLVELAQVARRILSEISE